MADKFLFETLESADVMGMLKDMPDFVVNNLSNNIELRDYQISAIKYFVTYFENDKLSKNKQIHNLFHMATGSGKTVIMASLILYLYTKGYRKFMFFVNQSNIIDKTKHNFINPISSKYLFKNEIEYAGNKIQIKEVDNFYDDSDDIQIAFTTIQQLHYDIRLPKENSLTINDFENQKIVFISDESHHINSSTKKLNKTEKNKLDEEIYSWENTIMTIYSQNKDNILLEFTATADLKNENVLNKYKDKIIYDYTLRKFRQSGYTKDFQNFATDSELWDRTLMALVISEYRKYLFADNKQDVKPVILLKSQQINESEAFYETFFDNIETLSVDQIENLYSSNIGILNTALNYFKNEKNGLEFLANSIKDSFTKDTAIKMNSKDENTKTNQIKVNSLEDKENNIRCIFTVDMLNEGWDVLNLFDIVRLYDTRQASGKAGKIGVYTIKEAQLIGRGARYQPFQIEQSQPKYKRKYDNDINNKCRILETLLYHSRNDSKYISELKQALIETGMDDPKPIKREYRLKDNFKKSKFYKRGIAYINRLVPVDRDEVTNIEGKLQTKTYHYIVKNNAGRLINLFDNSDNTENENPEKNINKNIKSIKFKEIDYNILRGAYDRFSELRFDFIKLKYPHVSSVRDFLTSDDYLGNVTLEISYNDEYSGKDLLNGCVKALSDISNHMIQIKEEYQGSKEFYKVSLSAILRDKSIYISKVDENGGKGDSQNNCVNEDYQYDLTNEDWYVFNDNYGTSEEKKFVKYFAVNLKPLLDEKELEYYLIRNERVPELAIYSFEHGERFEPDYLLFIVKKNADNFEQSQVFVEPKGNHLLEQDKWKEEFLEQIIEEASVEPILDKNEYKVVGMPFYNEEYRRNNFENAFREWIENI